MVSVSRPPLIDWPGLSASPGSRRSLLLVAVLLVAVLLVAVLLVAVLLVAGLPIGCWPSPPGPCRR
jgi:hypothetical protein